MIINTKRETLYGGFGSGKSKHYVTYLGSERVGNGTTKDESESVAKQALLDAFEYVTRSATVRVAKDGSIIVFRMIGGVQPCMNTCAKVAQAVRAWVR